MKSLQAAALCLVLSANAAATVKMDIFTGTWKDDFTDLDGLSYRKQAALAYPTGVTVDSGLQVWTQPVSTSGTSDSFLSGNPDQNISVLNRNTSFEQLSLWNERYEPGRNIAYNQVCALGGSAKCEIPPFLPLYRQNGQLCVIDTPIPQEVPNTSMSVAGWGLVPGSIPVLVWPNAQQIASILSFTGSPLVFGAIDSGLTPGRGYTVTYLAASTIDKTYTITGAVLSKIEDSNFLGCRVVNTKTSAILGEVVVSCSDFEGNFCKADGTYTNMLPVSLHIPAIPYGLYDFPVYSLATNIYSRFAVSIGPIYVTADGGLYESPVLDTLSEKTRWVDISWDLDQCTEYSDSHYPGDLRVAADSATTLTPVKISYGVANSPLPSPSATTWEIKHFDWEWDSPPHILPPPLHDFTLMHSGTLICDSVGAVLQGRYFRYDLYLYGRGAASAYHPNLAPSSIHPNISPFVYLGSLRPIVKRIAVRYFSCAARIESRTITPVSVRKWGAVTFRASNPSAGASVTVDVLAPDGTVLLGGVSSGDSLAGIDPYKHSSLKLRALLVNDPADCSMRPELEYWQVSWEPINEVLVLDRNGIRPDKGEVVRGQIRMNTPGHVTVQVHDAAGQSVKLLLDDDRPAQAVFVVWDGRNERGAAVAAGVYFVSAQVPGGEKVRRVAVIR